LESQASGAISLQTGKTLASMWKIDTLVSGAACRLETHE
jgi:hypothetical protein